MKSWRRLLRWWDEREPNWTKRQHTIMAWSLLALGRGLLYLPVLPGYGDFPQPLRSLFREDQVWISGAIWLAIGLVGVLYAVRPSIPVWLRQGWWLVLIAGVAGWGSMYCSAILLPHNPMTFRLFMAGELYLAVAYAIASTRGDEPESTAWRQRRDHHSSGGT